MGAVFSLQVAITGQLGVKAPAGSNIPLAATNFRIQGKDVLRLPPSSITTDAKGQTVLRITPDMMATLAKSQVTTVKLTQDLFGTGSGTVGKGISATLHVHPAESPAKAGSASAPPSTSTGTTVVKVTPDLKPADSPSSAFRLMPALGVSVAEQKGKNTVAATSDSKPAATIRIVQGLGVVPPKAGQTITVAAHTKPGSSVAGASGTVHTSAVSLPSINATMSKTVAVASGAANTPISIGPGAPTVRQVPVSTTVVSTSQTVSSVQGVRPPMWGTCLESGPCTSWPWRPEALMPWFPVTPKGFSIPRGFGLGWASCDSFFFFCVCPCLSLCISICVSINVHIDRGLRLLTQLVLLLEWGWFTLGISGIFLLVFL